jgi:hypothetical protein
MDAAFRAWVANTVQNISDIRPHAIASPTKEWSLTFKENRAAACQDAVNDFLEEQEQALSRLITKVSAR